MQLMYIGWCENETPTGGETPTSYFNETVNFVKLHFAHTSSFVSYIYCVKNSTGKVIRRGYMPWLHVNILTRLRLFGATGLLEASRISPTIYRHYCLYCYLYSYILLYVMPVVKFVQNVKRDRLSSFLHPPLLARHHFHFYRAACNADAV